MNRICRTPPSNWERPKYIDLSPEQTAKTRNTDIYTIRRYIEKVQHHQSHPSTAGAKRTEPMSAELGVHFCCSDLEGKYISARILLLGDYCLKDVHRDVDARDTSSLAVTACPPTVAFEFPTWRYVALSRLPDTIMVDNSPYLGKMYMPLASCDVSSRDLLEDHPFPALPGSHEPVDLASSHRHAKR